jgi:hypothetical protein
LKLDSTGKVGGAQTISFLTHAGMLFALVLFVARAPSYAPLSSVIAHMDHEPLLVAASNEEVSRFVRIRSIPTTRGM